MNAIEKYHERICQMYMLTHPDVNPDKVKQICETLTNKHLKDIPCVMHNNVTHEKIDSTLINTFEWIDQRSPIITGNGTFFKQHEEYLAPTVVFLEYEQKDRKVKKKEMFQFPKGSVGYANKFNAQLNIKKIMNSDYGGSGTTLSPFFSVYLPPATTGTAKNMTTTLICCLEFISGNNDPWAKCNTINELYDMIHIVLNTDISDRDMIHDTFTVDQICQHLISKCNYVTKSDMRVLSLFLSKLNNDQLCQLMLAFNVRFVLNQYCSSAIENIMGYLKCHQIDLDNMSEETIRAAGYGVKPPDEIVSDIQFIKDVIVNNCIYPFLLNDCEIRAAQMKRQVVCVTDTDSLMVQFASYIDDFHASVQNFRNSCLISSALGMRLFIEAIIPKFVEYIAICSNIKDKYYRDKFVFKNEFAFLAMTLFAKKMYSSSMFVQEGTPRDIHKIAISGLSFKKRDSAEFLEPIMTDLYDKYILTTDNIRVEKLLDEFTALREKLLLVLNKETFYHKVLGVKSVDAYDPNKVLPAQMRGAINWNNMFPEEEILPMDRVTVIPLSFDLLEQHQDNPYLSKLLKLCLIDNDKRKVEPVICLPEKYKHIPEWLSPAIDVDYCADKLLSPFKQLLGLFDIFMPETKGGMRPSRMLYL